jgi:hypothetical protein
MASLAKQKMVVDNDIGDVTGYEYSASLSASSPTPAPATVLARQCCRSSAPTCNPDGLANVDRIVAGCLP